jgi:hypothetical protein
MRNCERFPRQFDFLSLHLNRMILWFYVGAVGIRVDPGKLCAEKKHLSSIEDPKQKRYERTSGARKYWRSRRRAELRSRKVIGDWCCSVRIDATPRKPATAQRPGC